MIEIILFLLGIISLVEFFIIYRKLKQVDKYQQITEQYESWIYSFALTVDVINKELEMIDAEGTFRSDDEIGFFYQSMYSILKRLEKYGFVETEKEQKGDKTNEQKKEESIFYQRDRELHRRIQSRRRPEIEIEDIQRKNTKTTK